VALLLLVSGAMAMGVSAVTDEMLGRRSCKACSRVCSCRAAASVTDEEERFDPVSDPSTD
jgi:hypothetical protein